MSNNSEMPFGGAASENTSIAAALSALFAGVGWGLSGTLAAFLPPELSPLVIAAARLETAGILLLVLHRFSGNRPLFPSRDSWRALAVSALGLAVMQVSFFAGIRLAGVGLVTMIYIGLTPLFGGIAERLVDGVRPAGRWYVSVGIVLAGSALLAGANWLDLVSPWGIVLGLTACLGWSSAGLAMKRVQRNTGALETTTLAMLLAGVLLLPVYFFADPVPLLEFRSLWLLPLIGAVSAALPYGLYNQAVRHIPAGIVFILAMSEPLTAAVLSVIVLGERFSLLHLTGYGIILLGMVVLVPFSSRRSWLI